MTSTFLRLGVLFGLLLSPAAASAQPGFTVEGRVVEKNGTAGIPDATLELEGISGSTAKTAEDGRFRFEAVEPGGYTVRVLRSGYRPRIQYVFVDEDVALILPLAESRIFRERSWKQVRTVGHLRGVVREGASGLPLPAVHILTDLGRSTTTGDGGTFLLDRVPRDHPHLVSVRAFGYLPLDTVVRPGASARWDFKLIPDPAVQRRIDRKVELLGQGSIGRFRVVGSLSREALLASGAATLAEAVRVHFGSLADRVACFVVDDGATEPPADPASLSPGRLQRVEILSDGRRSSEVVVRVHTRHFVRDLVAGAAEATSVRIEYIHEAGSGSSASAASSMCLTQWEAEP